MPDPNRISAVPFIVLGLAVLVAGCSETSAPTPLAPGGAAFAKPDHAGGGGGGESSSPSTVPVRVDWDDDLVVDIDGQPMGAGIIGDGLGVDGVTPGASAYQDGVCGVNADIYTDSNYGGEMVFDTYTADECGARRVHYFSSGLTTEPLEVATKTIARELWSMEPGQETDHWEGFHFGLPQCDRVVYGAEYETEDLKRTRLDDGTGARQWRVESQGSHRARCVYWAKGKDRVGAFTDPMPFAFTVTEVLP